MKPKITQVCTLALGILKSSPGSVSNDFFATYPQPLSLRSNKVYLLKNYVILFAGWQGSD